MTGLFFRRICYSWICAAESAVICRRPPRGAGKRLHKRGLVVGISGGIDSSVTAALCVRAVGAERVDRAPDARAPSADETAELSGLLADHLGIRKVHCDITPILEAVGLLRQIRRGRPTVFRDTGGLEVQDRRARISRTTGPIRSSPSSPRPRTAVRAQKRLDARVLPGDRRGHELQTAHPEDARILLRRPLQLCRRRNAQPARSTIRDSSSSWATARPTSSPSPTSTRRRFTNWPGTWVCRPDHRPAADDRYLFAAPGTGRILLLRSLRVMDLCLYGKNNGFAPEAVAPGAGISEERARAVYVDIDRKRLSTRYLHAPPILAVPIPEIGSWKDASGSSD